MTIGEYITQKFSTFGITLPEADLLDVTMSGLDLNAEVNEDNIRKVNISIAGLIPQILALPESVNESGFSISWDKDSLRKYYYILCDQLGIENQLTSYIEDISEIW